MRELLLIAAGTLLGSCLGKVQGIDLENNKAVLFELNIENDRCIFPNTISDAIIDANKELKDLEDNRNGNFNIKRGGCNKCSFSLGNVLSGHKSRVIILERAGYGNKAKNFIPTKDFIGKNR